MTSSYEEVWPGGEVWLLPPTDRAVLQSIDRYGEDVAVEERDGVRSGRETTWVDVRFHTDESLAVAVAILHSRLGPVVEVTGPHGDDRSVSLYSTHRFSRGGRDTELVSVNVDPALVDGHETTPTLILLTFRVETPWVDPDEALWPCPCCGYRVHEQPASYRICHICGWEDEGAQSLHPTRVMAPNGTSLILAQTRFHFVGTQPRHVPDPVADALRRPVGWRIVDLARDADDVPRTRPGVGTLVAKLPIEDRCRVAADPAADAMALYDLVGDADWRVRAAVVGRPDLDSDDWEFLLSDEVAAVRAAAARSTVIDDASARQLAIDSDGGVREALAENATVSSSVVSTLSRDAERRVRVRAAAHPSISDIDRLRLLEDSEQQVRWAAEERRIIGR